MKPDPEGVSVGEVMQFQKKLNRKRASIDPKAFEAMCEELDDISPIHKDGWWMSRKELRKALRVYLKTETNQK